MNLKTVASSVILLVVLSPTGNIEPQTDKADQGIDAVEVINATATVEKVDLEKRKVTLLLDDGTHKTVKVDKSVQNLNQVNVGDHLKLAYTEEIIIVIGKSNETPGAAAADAVGVAPKGANPGIVMVDTTVVRGKILAVDAQKHRVTIEDPDGKKKTLKVSKKVTNLDQLQAGETFDMSVTEALAVKIIK